MTGKGEYAFGKAKKLLNKKEFDRVFRKGFRKRGSFIEIIALANQRGVSRLGLAVSRRTGGAVQRNRIKRVIREVFRTFSPLAGESVDLVVTARKYAAKAAFSEIQEEFKEFTKRRY